MTRTVTVLARTLAVARSIAGEHEGPLVESGHDFEADAWGMPDTDAVVLKPKDLATEVSKELAQARAAYG